MQNKLHCAGNKQKKKRKVAVARLKSIYFADITRIKRPQSTKSNKSIKTGGRQQIEWTTDVLFGIQYILTFAVKAKMCLSTLHKTDKTGNMRD